VRVVLVGPYPVDVDRPQGGVEASFATLVRSLAELPDVDPHVVAFVPGLRRERTRDLGTFRVDYLPTLSRLRSATLHMHERRALRMRLASLRPDLVHAQDAHRHGFICIKAVDRRLPLVLSIHGIARAELEFVESRLARLRMTLADIPLERYCIRTARFLVQPTRYPERYFGDEVRGRIWDVGNPIADAFFDVSRDPDPARILYLGAVIPRKRLVDLVEALARVADSHPTVTLRVVGFDANPAYAARIRERVRELELVERVVFLQGLSAEEVLDEYARASVLVLPSGEETSPMVIGEAMAAGAPVIATNVGGVSFLVEDGVTGHLTEPGDVPTLANRISSLLADPEARDVLGAAGKAKAERDFRASAVASRVADVYREVLSSGEPSQPGT
jgi:glycosyltransferase involved in cell wall biosynthesis